jgi:predicted flap endonuclease-1-like 5' DNA nuclease
MSNDTSGTQAPAAKKSIWPKLGYVGAAVTGGVIGFALVKGALLAKSAAAAQQLALGAKTAAGSAQAAATPLSGIQGAVSNGAAHFAAVPSTASGAAAHLSAAPEAASGALTNLSGAQAASTGIATWGSKLSGLFSHALEGLQGNLAPLAAGTLGGGAAGLGLAARKSAKAAKGLQEQAAQIETLGAQAGRIEQALNAAASDLQALKTQATRPNAPASAPAKEALEDIHGIGEVYAERLRKAGIHSFAQLAAATVGRVRDIIGRGSHLTDDNIKDWIEEARGLAG